MCSALEEPSRTRRVVGIHPVGHVNDDLAVQGVAELGQHLVQSWGWDGQHDLGGLEGRAVGVGGAGARLPRRGPGVLGRDGAEGDRVARVTARAGQRAADVAGADDRDFQLLSLLPWPLWSGVRSAGAEALTTVRRSQRMLGEGPGGSDPSWCAPVRR